jgi:hypothetical protein
MVNIFIDRIITIVNKMSIKYQIEIYNTKEIKYLLLT